VEKIYVDLKERSYFIYFEDDFEYLSRLLEERTDWKKFLIVTDSNVDKEYAASIEQILTNAGKQCCKFVFNAGEQSKCLKTISDIYRVCIDNRLDRNSVIIALGGGVTGDMAGFAAATYMRGIRFIQVPTSLLAQVDSSVGGKVGVDFQGTKNIIGAFHQPAFVYINISTLKTLPKREFVSGMAEVIKHAVIYDSAFFDYLEQNMDQILSLDLRTLRYVIKRNCEIKSSIVQQDEKEQGLRAILNFGHTIGHAIESVYNFQFLHGECVSLGMVAVGRLACNMDIFSAEDHDRMTALLKKVGLPVKLENVDVEAVYNEMLKDKKQRDNQLKFILPVEIGKVIQSTEITKDMIFDVLK